MRRIRGVVGVGFEVVCVIGGRVFGHDELHREPRDLYGARAFRLGWQARA